MKTDIATMGLVIGLCTAVTYPVVAVESEITHLLSGRWAGKKDARKSQMLDLTWLPEARLRFDNGGRLTGLARFRLQPVDGMRPADLQGESYSATTRPALIGKNAEVELRELYYERPLADWYLTLGKQQIVWGKADGLKVLDVVNPQSFKEFILEDFEQSRMPLWSLNAERSFYSRLGGDWTLQLLWLPDQTYNTLPELGGTFAFTSPRFVPQAPAGITVRLIDPERPNDTVADSDAGLRVSGFVSGWDLSLNYLYQYNNQPVLHQRLTYGAAPVLEIKPRYNRTHLFGGTFSRALGHWVLRGELGYFSDRHFVTQDPQDGDGVAESAELSYVLGLDWSGLADTFISAQLFQSRLPDYSDGINRPERDTSFTFLVRREFWNDTLTAQLLWIVNNNDGDGVIRPKVRYELDDDISLGAGASIFYGDKEGLFGQFDDNDRLLVSVELGF